MKLYRLNTESFGSTAWSSNPDAFKEELELLRNKMERIDYYDEAIVLEVLNLDKTEVVKELDCVAHHYAKPVKTWEWVDDMEMNKKYPPGKEDGFEGWVKLTEFSNLALQEE